MRLQRRINGAKWSKNSRTDRPFTKKNAGFPHFSIASKHEFWYDGTQPNENGWFILVYLKSVQDIARMFFAGQGGGRYHAGNSMAADADGYRENRPL